MQFTRARQILLFTYVLFVGISLVPQPTLAHKEPTRAQQMAEAALVTKRVRAEHLDFVATKLDTAVESGDMTVTQKRKVLDVLQRLMKSQPSSYDFVAMSATKKQQAINRWKVQAARDIKSSGVTLEELREITGKGNKYLMGIEF